MEFKKVKYASVTLDVNSYSVLNVIFDDSTPVNYYSMAFSEDEVATMDNGSFYVMNDGVADAAHIYNGQVGLTYAYVLNQQRAMGDPKFIDIITYCHDRSGYVGRTIKQITAEFAEAILKQFNLPFHLEYDESRHSMELMPNDIDSKIGTSFFYKGVHLTVKEILHPNKTEDWERWNPICIHCETDRGRDYYLRFSDVPEFYPGIIGTDPDFENR